MLLIIIGISTLFLRNLSFDELRKKEERKTIGSWLDASYNNSTIHLAKLEEDPDNEDEKELERINTSMIDGLYELRGIISETEPDWNSKLTLEIKFLKDTAAYKEAGGDYLLTDNEIRHSLALNQKLLDESIKPEHENYSLAMPNFMRQVVDLYISLGAIIIMILLIGEMLSAEFETHSINLLFTQPLKRTRIITSKFWSAIIIYLFTTGILLGAVAIIGSILGEKGTFDYPVVIEGNNGMEYLTISEYMTQTLIILTVTIVMVIALYLLYSLLLKHTLSTLFVLLGTLLAGYGLTWVVSWVFFAWFNPFQYLLPADAVLLQNERVWYQGIPVVLLVTVVLFLISRQKIKSSKIG